MIFYCERVECPHCRTITTTRIDSSSRMPATVHVCSYPCGMDEIIPIKDIEQNIDCYEYEGKGQYHDD